MSGKRFSGEQSSVGLQAALKIICGWRATPDQACKILRISLSTYRRVLQGANAGRRLDLDQMQRISLVLGIHSSLRTVFSNPENVQGFPGFKNDNDFFEGRTPLEIMSQGNMIAIYETYKRIARLKQLERRWF